MRFANRAAAGRELARIVRVHPLVRDVPRDEMIVLGLPRGGVPVADEVARALACALDVIIVRKIGVPSQPELAMGAIGEDDVRVVSVDVMHTMHVTPVEFAAVEARERVELERRARALRGDAVPASLARRLAIVVDDGIATGSTARAACAVAREHGARHVVLAAPVAAASTIAALGDVVDAVVTVAAPEHFGAIGQFYDDFAPTREADVVAILDRSRREALGGGPHF
jgi:putative phosphoribosyl transferase